MKSIVFKYMLITYLITMSVYTDVRVVQEGSSLILNYSNNLSFSCDTFLWSQNNIDIVHCINDRSSANTPLSYTCTQPGFIRKVEFQLTLNKANEIATNLTIASVYRNSSGSDEGLWKLNCTDLNTPTITTFEVKMYSKPKMLNCTYDILDYGLSIVCQGAMYPQANFLVNTTKNKNIPGTCQNVNDSLSLKYNFSCNYTIQAANLSVGQLQLNITIYPDLTSSIADRYFGESSSISLNLENPSIDLSNCQDKGINENMIFNCTCQRSDRSLISTMLIWQINGTSMPPSTEMLVVLTSKASRYTTNFTCFAINVWNWSSNPKTIIPSILYPADVTQFLVNGISRNETFLENGSSLKIHCEAIGNPEPSQTLMKNVALLDGTNKNNYTLTFEKTADCRDSGVYVCSANNNLGNAQIKSTVLIKCPQQLQEPFNNEQTLKSFDGWNVSIKLFVFGYPKPVAYKLYRSDVLLIIKNESISKTEESRKYNIKYYEENVINGTVELTIFNMSSEDFDNYTLAIYNGEKGNLTFLFNIEKNVNIIPNRGGVDDFNWPALVGGLAAALIVIILIVIIFVKKSLIKIDEDMVDIINDDVYWIDFSGEDKKSHPCNIAVKKYSVDYVSPITSASAPPGNYINYSARK